jgi:hypothetical protein
MLTRKCLLLCVAVVAIAALLTATEVLAACLASQVKCGTVKGVDVCVDISPTATNNPDGSCTFQWSVFNAGTIGQTAIAYECSFPPTRATNPLANGCGVGSFAFQGANQLDSVTITQNSSCSNQQSNCQRVGYTINSPCAQRGPNDVVFKFGNTLQTCSGSVEGFGITNTFETTVDCQVQALGDSGCEITTCFVRGNGNRIIDYDTDVTKGSCVKTLNKAPLSTFPGNPTDVPDGTVLKFGNNSCYPVTYNRQTTWISSGGSICPP